MKRIFMIAAVFSVFTACKSKTDVQTTKDIVTIDTTQLYRNSFTTDTAQQSFVNRNAAVVPAPAPRNTTPLSPARTSRSNTAHRSSGSSSNNASTSSTASTQTAKKKGWSSAAKGAVIGGVGGAVVGAVVSKNKVAGAVIGGAVGAAGGYIIGRKKDKKTGRVPQ